MALDAKQLLGMSQAELDTLFSAHEAGPVPDGEGAGTAIIAPGTWFSPDIAAAINIFAWKGKVFDAKAGFLRNEILPFGLKAIVARVYKAASWLDGKECIVLDYSETSLVASHVRDEIRLVDEGFYLGKVYWDSKRLIDFSLDFRNTGARRDDTVLGLRPGSLGKGSHGISRGAMTPQDHLIVVAAVPDDRVADLRALLATMTLPGLPAQPTPPI